MDDSFAPQAVFSLVEAEGGPAALFYSSPHAGRWYPKDMGAEARLLDLQRMEDAFVDQLIADAPALGADLLTMNVARAYLDVNREPSELDASLFDGDLSRAGLVASRTFRVEQGLGLIPRDTARGPIYRRKLSPEEGRARLDLVYHPYHSALEQGLARACQRRGFVFLIDWHSMPRSAVQGPGAGAAPGRRAPDFVLGDRHGASCSPLLVDLVEALLEEAGYRTARNNPFAGGRIAEHYGRRDLGRHALQIEINRALYMDEMAVRPTEGFARARRALAALTAELVRRLKDEALAARLAPPGGPPSRSR